MKLQTSNFAAESRVGNTKQKMKKLGQKGAWPRSRDLLLNFGTPLLSPVRMKLQTSNFAAVSAVRNTKQNMKNWAKKGRGLGYVTYF